jgi:hypothetical protein
MIGRITDRAEQISKGHQVFRKNDSIGCSTGSKRVDIADSVWQNNGRYVLFGNSKRNNGRLRQRTTIGEGMECTEVVASGSHRAFPDGHKKTNKVHKKLTLMASTYVRSVGTYRYLAGMRCEDPI